MSPHAVNSFVSDLVEMAKAMDQVPTLEAEISRLKSVEADLIQAKDYAASLEQRLHDAEVARDDAEFRFLELDEKTNKVLGWIKDSESANRHIRLMLDPPKPEPQPEPVNVPITEGQDMKALGEEIALNYPSEPQDQSEAGFTDHTVQSTTATTMNAQTVEETDGASTSIEPLQPSPGPYSSLHYYDHPAYVSRHDWLSGGGTDESYDWKPENKSIFG